MRDPQPSPAQSATETPAQACGTCGYVFDHATGLETGTVPCAGDVTLCLHCGATYVFKADLTVRPITARELSAPKYRDVYRTVERARRTIEAARQRS